MASVKFTIGEAVVEAVFEDTPTAKALLDAMPMETTGNYWGGEFYFSVPVKSKPDATAREVVEPGTIAFWTEGSCLCLFWGPTPVSKAGECRAASSVNVVGRVRDSQVLTKLKGRGVRVERAG
jgi:hypothetical protein